MKSNENEWISISDLMSGLMMIFLFVALALLIPEKNENKQVKEVLDNVRSDLNRLNDALDNTFAEDFKKWGAVRLRDGTVRFQEPRVMFLAGSYKVPERFKKILGSFCPRYAELLKDHFNEETHEIRVIGHASSEWKAKRLRARSFKNIVLSANRALQVHVLCYDSLNSSQRKWFTKKTISVGAGFVHKIKDKEEQEIKWLSRRVEFRVQLRSLSSLQELLRNGKIY